MRRWKRTNIQYYYYYYCCILELGIFRLFSVSRFDRDPEIRRRSYREIFELCYQYDEWHYAYLYIDIYIILYAYKCSFRHPLRGARVSDSDVAMVENVVKFSTSAILFFFLSKLPRRFDTSRKYIILRPWKTHIRAGRQSNYISLYTMWYQIVIRSASQYLEYTHNSNMNLRRVTGRINTYRLYYNDIVQNKFILKNQSHIIKYFMVRFGIKLYIMHNVIAVY